MNEVIFDMRCLQDPAYRERGVGKVASAIVIHARQNFPEAQSWKIVGLLDIQLPDLAKNIANALDEVRYTADYSEAGKNILFVNLSPMTHDPLFVARFLNDPSVFCSTIFYDFIPLTDPAYYLPDAAQRLSYGVMRHWLSRYRIFGAISQTSADELHERLGIPLSQIITVGAPLDDSFQQVSAQRKRSSILVIGGGDKRKNVECAIRAHGESRILNDQSIELITTGNYPKNWIRELQDIHSACGGRRKLLSFAGHIDQSQLVDLYRSALCVVCMSRAEGFSLPVIEAIACGTPVIASDIAAHRELIKLPDYLIPCDAADGVRLRMEEFVQDGRARASFLSAHGGTPSQFTEQNVAHVFWSFLLNQFGQTKKHCSPHVRRGWRPKLAFVTPMPPVRSGVADYTAACLRELGRLADLEVFTNTSAPCRIEGVSSFWPMSSLPYISRSFDRVVSVLGNSHYHLEIFRNLTRFGGACIQHDNRLLGFYSILLGRERAERVAQRELKRPLQTGELDRWLADEAVLEATFLGEVAEISKPLFLHSKRTGELLHERFGKRARILPFAVYRQWDEEEFSAGRKCEARRRLGIAPDEICIVSFGFVHQSKAPKECIFALEMLRSWNIPAKLYFVGEVGRDLNDFRKLCREIGIENFVSFSSDYVGEDQYRAYLLAADLAIQLRTHLFGGLSGALLDCIAVGLPVVANTDLAESMDAPSYVERVNDRPSPVLIANAAAKIIDRAAGEVRHSEERRSFMSIHNFSNYARQLSEGLGLDVAGRHAA